MSSADSQTDGSGRGGEARRGREGGREGGEEGRREGKREGRREGGVAIRKADLGVGKMTDLKKRMACLDK